MEYMEILMERISDNFDLSVAGWGTNTLGQPYVRIIVCNKGYSIVSNNDGTYELGVVTDDGESLICYNPLTISEILADMSERSAEYMDKLFSNHLAVKHGIGV